MNPTNGNDTASTSQGEQSTDASPPKHKKVLCPYCGNTQAADDRCEACGGLFEPLSRQATQISMGPWFIRDKQQPFRPGCSYEVIKRMASNGRLTPTTILRGPTTHQFWALARNVRGVAHLLGVCYQCHHSITPNTLICPHCKSEQSEPKQFRNELGLQYPTDAMVKLAKTKLEQSLIEQNRPAPQTAAPTLASMSAAQASAADSKPAGDLLDRAMQMAGQNATPPPPPSMQQPAAPPQPAMQMPSAAPQPQQQPHNTAPIPAPEAPSGGMSVGVWILIFVNVVLALGVAALFFISRGD